MKISNLKIGDLIQFNTGPGTPMRMVTIKGINSPYFDCVDWQGHYMIHGDDIYCKVINLSYDLELIDRNNNISTSSTTTMTTPRPIEV